MRFGRYVLALGAALITSLTLQVLVMILSVTLFKTGAQVRLESFSASIFYDEMAVEDVGMHLLEFVTAVAGVAAAAYILPLRDRALGCWIISAICLLVAGCLFFLIPEHSPTPYAILPRLYGSIRCLTWFAPGGLVASIFFTLVTLRRNKGKSPLSNADTVSFDPGNK